MAQKVQVLLVDDVDGGTADETVTFGLDGVTYEIDLTTENAAKLRDALGTWVGHARRVGGRSSSGRSSGRSSSAGSSSSRAARANEAQEIREWAKSNGYQVSERGRISAEVKQAYDDAH
ncbi:histone-like nucleoid-structuring protein Lsr2 [Cellulomonas shaoxiangyii]|uniref:Lsr2 family protein n=1 Tax=Cellulomonas shaoxiangyii TaxID=2566013 RepID=A0A4P7SLK0_9CELL|nr:Lsr2 family protein [Cellulomonas shaoxiangyii]QCB94608.1 Lsr2 family protein [Cellulomonas shaoxiangyii]TGY84148.1 Lsr2 family protein [Cellulomonas shaoxiangyii]